MSKHIIENNYRRFDPVGQSNACADCSVACKTSCARKLAQDMTYEVHYYIDDPNEKKVEVDRYYDVTIKEVDSIPCSLKEQKLKYTEEGELVEGELNVPWPMDWIYSVIENYLKKDRHLSGTKKVDLTNPEEEDQFVTIEVVSYIERQDD